MKKNVLMDLWIYIKNVNLFLIQSKNCYIKLALKTKKIRIGIFLLFDSNSTFLKCFEYKIKEERVKGEQNCTEANS